MDTRAISTILLKVAGLIVIVLCVGQVPGYFSVMTREAGWTLAQVLGTIGLTLGPLAILGIGLWFFPGTVANRIVSGAPVPESTFDPRPLELIALTVVGIYLVAHAIIDIAYNVALAITLLRVVPDLANVPPSVIARIAAALVQIIIGVALCIGGRGVLRLVERMRG
jgi:hypothetical protein